jgi:tetratricopeptide (TPR) repeat protein
MAEGEYDQAIACFDKAIKAESKFPEAHCNRGTAYYEKGQYDEAIKNFDRAIELKPEFSEAYYNRAMVHYYKQQYDQAWDDMNKAQSLGHYVAPDLLETLRRLTGRVQ